LPALALGFGVLLRFAAVQSFDTKPDNSGRPMRSGQTITLGRVEELPAGRCATVELADGCELAVYNVGGEFYATENFCPHRGAPLAEGQLTGHVIACFLHGWQFDVRTGECLTESGALKTYRVLVEDGLIKIVV
jgi:nitrite reductase/ring-hydroxylating ferredoxin subunit